MSPTAEQLLGDLVHRYADAVTRRDVAQWVSCWDEDGRWEIRADRVAHGRPAAVALLERALASLEGVVQNVLHGAVRVDGQAACGRWSLSEHYRKTGGEAGLLLFAYDDTYVEREGKWLFASRTLVPSYTGPPDLSGTFQHRDQPVSGRLRGKVAVITGGAGGIGAGTVRRFVQEGAAVVVVDLQVDAGKALVDELGDRARFVEADVSEEYGVAAAVDVAVAEFGQLDCMFNNAGILGAVGPISATPVEAWDRSVAVLLRSVFLGMKHAARVMVLKKSGVILSTSSTAGVVGGLGPHAYTACKTAVVGLTRSVAAELAPHGVRVNAIAPGRMVTGMTAFAYTGDTSKTEEAAAAIKARSNLGIAGEPVDIANAAVYLASDEARYITGHCLVVDAGETTNAGHGRFAAAAPDLVQAGGQTA